MPSSRDEHSMPKLSTPRILAFLILKLPGSTAPIRAQAVSSRTQPERMANSRSRRCRRGGSSSGGGAKAATVKPPKNPAGGSWKLVNGSYSYLYSDGTKAVNCWLEIDGQWYYFNMQGVMATGWLKDGGNYFYLNPATGSMVTGWQQIDGKWYYFNERSDGFKGMMYADTITPDGYEVDGNGAWVQ